MIECVTKEVSYIKRKYSLLRITKEIRETTLSPPYIDTHMGVHLVLPDSIIIVIINIV